MTKKDEFFQRTRYDHVAEALGGWGAQIDASNADKTTDILNEVGLVVPCLFWAPLEGRKSNLMIFDCPQIHFSGSGADKERQERSVECFDWKDGFP